MAVSETLFGLSVGYFGWVGHYFGWVGVNRKIFWVVGGGWVGMNGGVWG